MIKYTFLSVYMLYFNDTTKGWNDLSKIVFSRIVASISCNLTMSTFFIVFIAYFLSVSFLVTKYTYPTAPLPRGRSIIKSEIVRFFLLNPLLPDEEQLERESIDIPDKCLFPSYLLPSSGSYFPFVSSIAYADVVILIAGSAIDGTALLLSFPEGYFLNGVF